MQAYTFQQKALLRLLEALFALAGIVPGGEPAARLPRLVRNEVLRVLLPLESALRRIIYFRMKRLSAPSDEAKQRDKSKTKRKRRKSTGESVTRRRAAVFWLFDKLKWFPDFADSSKRPRRGPGPCISSFDGRDRPRESAAEKPVRDPDDATKICRRLQAAMRALCDIDGQAKRLRRIIAARRASPKPRQTCPLRPGFAPGYRRGHPHEVDRILYECNHMANERVPPVVS